MRIVLTMATTTRFAKAGPVDYAGVVYLLSSRSPENPGSEEGRDHMQLSSLHRTRVLALWLASICIASVGLVCLSTRLQFAGATAASIASVRPNYVPSTAPANSNVPTPF